MRLNKKFIAASILIFSIVLTTILFYLYQAFYTQNILLGDGDDKAYFVIPEETKFKVLLKKLTENEIVHDGLSFALVAKMMDYQENIKKGLYRFDPGMSNREAIVMLRAGAQTPIDITLTASKNLKQVAGKLTQVIEPDSSGFYQLISDKTVQDTLGFDSTTMPAFFIPNTYEVYWTISEEELLKRMQTEYHRFWNAKRKAKAEKIGLTPVEVSTLASIVHAETNKTDEMDRIAGVYINRLKKGMKLQADPTVKFSTGNPALTRILYRHLEIDSPYNTYKYKGLPPGPINIPSLQAINAVLNYENHDYLYFVAREDLSGYHTFAKTLKQHNFNKKLYLAAAKKAGYL